MLELINRARMNPVAEAARFGISLNSGLAAGTHTFRVQAIDRAGNGDPTPATRTFTVLP